MTLLYESATGDCITLSLRPSEVEIAKHGYEHAVWSIALLQTILSQFDGAPRSTLSGEIDAGSVSSGTDVIDDNGTGSVRLAYGQDHTRVGPGHYATNRGDTV